MSTYDWEQLFEIETGGGDYGGSGFILAFHKGEGRYTILRYGHCSCYGPWEGADWDSPRWQGTLPELIEMAQNNKDWDVPDRRGCDEDEDALGRKEVYAYVLSLLPKEPADAGS